MTPFRASHVIGWDGKADIREDVIVIAFVPQANAYPMAIIVDDERRVHAVVIDGLLRVEEQPGDWPTDVMKW